jgi:hypothetical protein
MKAIRITSTAILSLLLGIAAPACAQQKEQGEKQDHPKQQQNTHEQARPAQQRAQQQRQPQQVQQQRQQNQNRQQQVAQQQRSHEQHQRQPQQAQQQQRQNQNRQRQVVQQQRSHEQHQRTQEQQRVERSAWQQHRAGNWQSDHRTWQQRGGYNGYRIPDDRFRGYFGPTHGFRIEGLPFLVVGGYPRFQYGGYWFSLVDPWPGYWANDWYDTDDVYVTYVDNGYYLFNRRYPTVGIAVNISM